MSRIKKCSRIIQRRQCQMKKYYLFKSRFSNNKQTNTHYFSHFDPHVRLQSELKSFQ